MRHPKGLYLLFFTEMWERFSYYGMRAMLILYLTKTAMEGGLGFDARQASLIYGFFTGFVYFTPLIGGWLADKLFGTTKIDNDRRYYDDDRAILFGCKGRSCVPVVGVIFADYWKRLF